MSINFKEIFLFILILFTGIGAYHLSTIGIERIKELKATVEKLEKEGVKDKRLDEVMMKTADGKEVSRLQVYDEVVITVVKSIQEATKEPK